MMIARSWLRFSWIEAITGPIATPMSTSTASDSCSDASSVSGTASVAPARYSVAAWAVSLARAMIGKFGWSARSWRASRAVSTGSSIVSTTAAALARSKCAANSRRATSPNTTA